MAEGPLILAVDDEPAVLRLLRLERTAQRFRIVTASGGEEALDLARAEHPDREYSTVPILLVSGGGTESAITEGMGRNADDYTVKPFIAAALGERLRTELRGPWSVVDCGTAAR